MAARVIQLDNDVCMSLGCGNPRDCAEDGETLRKQCRQCLDKHNARCRALYQARKEQTARIIRQIRAEKDQAVRMAKQLSTENKRLRQALEKYRSRVKR